MSGDLTRARELLRAELLAAAAAVVPGQPGFVTYDPGPAPEGTTSDVGATVEACTVTVEVGNPFRTDAGAEQITAAARTLHGRGWDISATESEAGHHRATAHRDGFDVTLHSWDRHWKVVLTGQTPDLPIPGRP